MSLANDKRACFQEKHSALRWVASLAVFGPTVISGLLTVGLIAGLLLVSERPARAYVDPGSGFLTLQLIGAWLAGGFFILRQKLKWSLFRKSADAFRDATSSVAASQNEGTAETFTGRAEL